ncbi:MAG: efflux RND transporter permease subunit [Acidobacteria bacterium]|nr:efflux RND transporter permease subunit [Acidobacteriota bacterium]
MLNRLIDTALHNRILVVAALAVLIGGGIFSLLNLPIDAFPDLTNNQVTIVTACPGMPPTEVERLVTWPMEISVMGLPRVTEARSISKFALSKITVVFDDTVSPYFARQLVNERLQEVRGRIPAHLEPGLGPNATPFGEVYQFTIEGEPVPLDERKAFLDWVIRPALRTVPGVVEVETWGGRTRQFEIEVRPESLERYNVSLADVEKAVSASNENFGGGFFEFAGEQYTVVGKGRVAKPVDLENIVITSRAGTPVLVRDVAHVRTGAAQRQGATLRDGRGESVSAMAIMLKGENSREVIERVKRRLATVKMPAGATIVPFYDQSEVINRTISTVRRNLAEAGLLVIAVLLLFLGNVRAALLVAAVIPLSLLAGFIGMKWFGVTANLMSLGAVDFGMIVDGAVVMMENAVARLGARKDDQDPLEVVRLAAHEVARPIVFAVGIIIAVYVPIFFLEGLEGRMFRPMAVTVVSALTGSLALALFAMPVLASYTLKHGVKPHKEEGWFESLRSVYRRLLSTALRHRVLTVVAGALIAAAALGSIPYLGTEFMPRLEEGSILVQTKKLPGVSLSDSSKLSTEVEKTLLKLPEVKGIVSKLGRPDLATDQMGIYEADVYVILHPQEQWKVPTKEELIAKMRTALEAVPGVAYNFTQPMAMRLDETISGIKADVAVKLFGENPETLDALAMRAFRILERVPGATDAQMEVTSGVAELHIEPNRAALARYGLHVDDIREVVEAAVGGRPVSDLIDGQRRFGIVVRLPGNYRSRPESLEQVRIQAPGGERLLLGQVASVRTSRGPEVVSRENGLRRVVVQCNVTGRDLGGFADEARRRVSEEVQLPPGYFIDWGGQFENQERALGRLALVLPISIIVIFALLYFTFYSMRQAMLILCNVPFALVGGVAALWIRGMNVNLSASIGFIALFGVAVLNGIVMVSQINRLRGSGVPDEEAVPEGAILRLRPVLMTALVASLGFLPMALSTSAGSEVQRPLASVVIGGLASSTLLTLFLLPAMYSWFTPRTFTPKADE